MTQITLVKKTINSKSGQKTMAQATENLTTWFEKLKDMEVLFKRNLGMNDKEVFETLYRSQKSRELLQTYQTERKNFFQKNGYLPTASIQNFSIEKDNVIQLVSDKISVNNTYLSLTQSSMNQLLSEMDYIMMPYDMSKDPLNIMDDVQRQRIDMLHEEVMVAIPFKSLQMPFILNSSFEFLQKIQVPHSMTNTWGQFMMMFPMFSAMQSQINDLKTELGATNKRLDNLTNDIQKNFRSIHTMFQNHTSTINAIINRIDSNSRELDVIHHRHADRQATGHKRVFSGRYEQVGYGTSRENDWGDVSWSHYYSVPIYDDVPFTFIIPANPTRPLAVLDNGDTISLTVKNPEAQISVNELKKQLSSHCFVFGKNKSNTYRLIYDNITQLSKTTGAFISEVVQFQIK